MFNSENKELCDLLKKIFIPILLIVGLFGNVVSIIIFNKKSMKKYSTFQYLTLLSILDLCVLYTGCGQIVLDVYYQIDIRLLNEFICKTHSFIVYFFTHFSSMLLASMSIDRTVAILSINLTKSSDSKTPFKIFFILGILIALINVHFILFIELYDYELDDSDQNSTSQIIKLCYAKFNAFYFIYLTNIYPWIDLSIYTIIPFTIMLVCSIIIILKIQKKSNEIRSLQMNSKSLSRNKQLIIILFVTNSLFVLLVFPLVILNATGNIKENTVITTVAYLLAYCNHA